MNYFWNVFSYLWDIFFFPLIFTKEFWKEMVFILTNLHYYYYLHASHEKIGLESFSSDK